MHVPLVNLDDYREYGRKTNQMRWDVRHERNGRIIPSLMDRRIDNIWLRRILTGPCRGQRGPAEIEREERPYFCISFIMSGSEVMNHGSGNVKCEPGDIVTWHSGQKVSFEVTESREKLAIYVPEDLMESALDGSARYAGLNIKHTTGIGALLAGYFSSLCGDLPINSPRDEAEIATITLDLIGSSISAFQSLARTPEQSALFERATDWIERNLEVPDLSPARIAGALGISVRYLHLLFAAQGRTVMDCVLTRRLARCRADLTRSRAELTITDVAYRWGFNDAAHFSRTFKARYGISPRAFCAAHASGIGLS
jgi:AraC-like DNA-binding protein